MNSYYQKSESDKSTFTPSISERSWSPLATFTVWPAASFASTSYSWDHLRSYHMRVKIIFYKHIVPLGSFSAVTYYVEKHDAISKDTQQLIRTLRTTSPSTVRAGSAFSGSNSSVRIGGCEKWNDLKFVKKNYTTQFSCERILHSENT